jgi:hypothetical protein
MADGSPLPTVIALPMFDRAAKGLLTEDDLDALTWRLSENPTEGVVMAETGGVRKLCIGLMREVVTALNREP